MKILETEYIKDISVIPAYSLFVAIPLLSLINTGDRKSAIYDHRLNMTLFIWLLMTALYFFKTYYD